MKYIAHIHTDFGSKFGVPRQSGLVPELTGRIVFEPEYRVAEAFRGLEGFSHIWLIWEFSEAVRDNWSPTVRPPRLGGNERMGVFATRSPFRPNNIGLSCVELKTIDYDSADGPALIVGGADLMDGTPIFDIKPYIAYADSHPEAAGGFTGNTRPAPTQVVLTDEIRDKLLKLFAAAPSSNVAAAPAEKLSALVGVLSQDPRPRYQNDAERIYGLTFSNIEVKFRAEGDKILIINAEPAISHRADG